MVVAIAPTLEELEADLAEIALVKGWNDAVMDARSAGLESNRTGRPRRSMPTSLT